ncbi:hypothetical protein G7054_g364 [Neopestalotiopsis clavispora]|nr:hypothetical protein G7054_g364 [Neopestalotiopsis clavispora]
MSAVTEIVQFNPKKDLNFDDAAHRLTRTIAQQSGVACVRYARRHEDPLKGAMFIDWERLSDHKAFTEKDYYGPFLEVVRHLVDGPLSIYHQGRRGGARLLPRRRVAGPAAGDPGRRAAVC